jgi:hypothetical protein
LAVGGALGAAEDDAAAACGQDLEGAILILPVLVAGASTARSRLARGTDSFGVGYVEMVPARTLTVCAKARAVNPARRSLR